GLLTEGGALQRAGVLVLALGLLGAAAAVHPRLDGGRRSRVAAASLGLAVAGLAGIFSAAEQRVEAAERTERWRAAHEARADEPIPDIISISGTVAIDPGRSLDADLVLELEAPPDRTLESVLLTLNPGLAVREAA